MKGRLSEEEIRGLERIVVGDDGVRPIMFPWMSRALDEIKERRALDLTAEEREALRFARYRLVEYPPESGSYVVRTKAALAILDRLLADKEER